MYLTTYSDVFIRDIFKYYSRTGLSKMIIKPVFIYYCMSTIYRVIYENFINVVVASMDRIIFDCIFIFSYRKKNLKLFLLYFLLYFFQVWFQNRRAKWRKTERLKEKHMKGQASNPDDDTEKSEDNDNVLKIDVER